MSSILYFAYGSNMNLDQMAMRCPGAMLGPVARLTGWKYFINGDGYAGIEKAEDSEVLGCLWTLQDKHWRALDHYEGVAGGYYERIELEVVQVADGQLIKCWVYLSCNYEYGVPAPKYQQSVVDGARQVNLPAIICLCLRAGQMDALINERIFAKLVLFRRYRGYLYRLSRPRSRWKYSSGQGTFAG